MSTFPTVLGATGGGVVPAAVVATVGTGDATVGESVFGDVGAMFVDGVNAVVPAAVVATVGTGVFGCRLIASAFA